MSDVEYKLPIESSLTPREIVHELDKYIIGQQEAKRAVAIALRNRWRRSKLDKEMREEVMPKNILMIGPTGVGKTEIARRLARLVKAPFYKVEATKFTEVGYVGRDVESIIRELIEKAIKEERENEVSKVRAQAEDKAEDRILDALLRPPAASENDPFADSDSEADSSRDDSAARQLFRKKLREGDLDDKEIDIEISAMSNVGVEIFGPPGMEDVTNQLSGFLQNLGSDKMKTRKMRVSEALKQLQEEEAHKLVNEDDLKERAIYNVEQNGIVFLDEFDKIAPRQNMQGDVSREGVQRDLLPLVEGSTVSTKYGLVKTDHILFIASGAFHMSKPSDLIPELQGRFPIRVELKSLGVAEFERILTEPNASLTEQYTQLLNTENVELDYTTDGIQKIAQIAWEVNEQTENIGARRLQTVMERLLEDISFEAPEKAGTKEVINAEYVAKSLDTLVDNKDLSHYIL